MAHFEAPMKASCRGVHPNSRASHRMAHFEAPMKSFTAVIERCPETGLFVGYVPGFPGAHSQGETIEELRENLREVIAMLLEDGEPAFESQFVGTQTIQMA